MMTEEFYNKAVQMVPVTPSKYKEFRFHFYDTLNSYYKLVEKHKKNLNLTNDKIKELKDIIEKIKDIIRNQYNGMHSTAFTSFNNLLGIEEENDVVSRLIITRIPANSKSKYW